VGHADHVEVIGTRGERPDATVVIESPDDARRLQSNGKPIAVVTQTTLSLDDVRSTVDALEERFGDLRRPAADDICYATQNRQDAVKRLAEQATLILVIGSQTSSNAQRLVEVARNAGAAARLIDGDEQLDADLLDGHGTIGLTAGASTPEELVQATVARLAALGWTELEEITVAREDVHFRLPREVAAR
jgi:4-hydroxy-3-methylbut-2-enyl diphosphate reductase